MSFALSRRRKWITQVIRHSDYIVTILERTDETVKKKAEDIVYSSCGGESGNCYYLTD